MPVPGETRASAALEVARAVLRRAERRVIAAERVVELAKRPRRAVILPWYYRVAIWADWNLPWLVDWITMSALTKKRNKYK